MLTKNKQVAINDLLSKDISSEKALTKEKRIIAKKYGISIPTNAEILSMSENIRPEVKQLLKKRAVRTMSGIAPVAILTKPYPCPGKCAYCPSEKDVPQSYLSNEPAVMRAIRCHYNPYTQVQDRLRALINNGHEPTKIELIVIGGTWSYLPRKYKYWYISESFRAANDFPKKIKSQIKQSALIANLESALLKEQKRNEKTKYNIIGLTLETRPDYINIKELLEMRDLGATRVELGVQAINDEILKKNKRGHGIKEIADATKLLKNFGFKVTYHIMPGLPGSTPEKDFEMFKQLFKDQRFQPDQIKFYPTVVTKGSLLYKWWKQSKYKPYTDKELRELIIKCKQIVPPYVRIIRLIRDIPGESIIAGNLITNLRQIMKDEGVKCNCIRCREIKDQQLKTKNYKLKITKYPASDGEEYFLSFEDNNYLLAFLRLRLPKNPIETNKIKELKDSAIIRELHVYGELVSIGSTNKKTQHRGLGQKLLQEAERIAKENNYANMSIISGVGVRDYYKKFSYKQAKTYMTKTLK